MWSMRHCLPFCFIWNIQSGIMGSVWSLVDVFYFEISERIESFTVHQRTTWLANVMYIISFNCSCSYQRPNHDPKTLFNVRILCKQTIFDGNPICSNTGLYQNRDVKWVDTVTNFPSFETSNYWLMKLCLPQKVVSNKHKIMRHCDLFGISTQVKEACFGTGSCYLEK